MNRGGEGGGVGQGEWGETSKPSLLAARQQEEGQPSAAPLLGVQRGTAPAAASRGRHRASACPDFASPSRFEQARAIELCTAPASTYARTQWQTKAITCPSPASPACTVALAAAAAAAWAAGGGPASAGGGGAAAMGRRGAAQPRAARASVHGGDAAPKAIEKPGRWEGGGGLGRIT